MAKLFLIALKFNKLYELKRNARLCKRPVVGCFNTFIVVMSELTKAGTTQGFRRHFVMSNQFFFISNYKVSRYCQ